MDADQASAFVEQLVEGMRTGARLETALQLRLLVNGPPGDTSNVAGILAGLVGHGAQLEPGETFHQLRVTIITPDGSPRPGSASELAPYVAVFAQMVVALQNNDPAMARDLYVGYVGDDRLRALTVITFGLAQLVHRYGYCSCQRGAGS